MTKVKIALAAVLFAATSSAAFAQGFGNMNSALAGTLQSAPVRLQKHGNTYLQSAPVLQQRDVALPTTSGGAYYEGDREFNVDRFDHASSPYAGGN